MYLKHFHSVIYKEIKTKLHVLNRSYAFVPHRKDNEKIVDLFSILCQYKVQSNEWVHDVIMGFAYARMSSLID